MAVTKHFLENKGNGFPDDNFFEMCTLYALKKLVRRRWYVEFRVVTCHFQALLGCLVQQPNVCTETKQASPILLFQCHVSVMNLLYEFSQLIVGSSTGYYSWPLFVTSFLEYITFYFLSQVCNLEVLLDPYVVGIFYFCSSTSLRTILLILKICCTTSLSIKFLNLLLISLCSLFFLSI